MQVLQYEDSFIISDMLTIKNNLLKSKGELNFLPEEKMVYIFSVENTLAMSESMHSLLSLWYETLRFGIRNMGESIYIDYVVETSKNNTV